MNPLLKKIRACTICKSHLPFPPKPILNFEPQAKILIVGQAPGAKAHESGTPWNDASGERLRNWLGVTKEQFYNPKIFAIVPMGFCYPGKGKSGDLPPRPECSEKWMKPVRESLKNIELTILIGQFAISHFLNKADEPFSDLIKNQNLKKERLFLLPHPSPRNNIWLKKNPWFEDKILPRLKTSTLPILDR